MRIQRQSLVSRQPALTLRRTFGCLVDLLLWSAAIAVLEVFRPIAIGDGADLIAICGLTFYGLALASGARAGLLPATRALGLSLKSLSRRFLASLAPRYAIAFRPSPGVRPLTDPALNTILVVMAGLAAVVTLFGGPLRDALLYVKTDIAYTPYLLVIAVVWAVLAGGLLMGVVASAQWVQERVVAGGGAAPRAVVLLAWAVGFALAATLPGIVPLAAVIVFAWWRLVAFGNRPTTPYLFCRRDERGRPRAIPVDVFLKRAFATVSLTLIFIVALAYAGRLFQTGLPDGPFALTTALGMLATVGASMLLLRVSSHFRALVGDGVPPEMPLTPTLWVRADATSPDVPSDVVQAAEAQGWRVVVDKDEPAGGFDLVVGDVDHPRRLIVDDGMPASDLEFRLGRRLNIVMRRRFWRGMKRLFKALRRGTHTEGSGFLFCPHVWLIQGVVRDIDPKDQQARGGSLIGPAYVGPRYATVFPLRVRRYMGGIMRSLGIDIVYWEDAIRWPDIKRVFGVAFEIHDQRRAPLEERHFVGVPGVRVLIQDDQAETEPPLDESYSTPAPGHMRVLLILKDRGGREELLTPTEPGSRRKEPHLV